ncbi:MAG: ABC transporter ATP-binding protein [Planctomycetota bacterium]
MLSVRHLEKDLGRFAFRNVSFEVQAGEYFALLGASGAGKTVLLETIAGLMTPDSGTIFLAGREITCEKIQTRGLALVYQDQSLFPHLTVRQNIAYGLRCRKIARAAARRRVAGLAEDVGVTHLLDQKPETLSGGEAQRVALGRALATEPSCLLLDEPISALDAGSRAGMRALLRGLNRRGLTIVHVTHDYEEAVSLASRVAIMERGKIAQVGTPDEVLHRPESEFVARFVGVRNFFKGNLTAPANAEDEPAEFAAAGLTFAVVTDAESGPGVLLLRSEDITVSNVRSESSARNAFEGTITDIAPAGHGVEVLVDIGVQMSAMITSASVRTLGLERGRKVWMSFKATAGKFLKG